MYGFVAGFEIIEQKINRHHLEAILKKVPEKMFYKKLFMASLSYFNIF
jgi:hypothetical protein